MNQHPALPSAPPTRAWPTKPVVAIVGATGLVGRTLVQVFGERVPRAELRLLAGPHSAGQGGVELATPAAFEGVDLAIFCATGEVSRALVPAALERGARVIDKSSIWRLAPEVPLIVPEVNAALVDAGTRMVASPNCTTTGLVMVLEPLRRAAGLARVHVTTLQSASGAGGAALEEWQVQERALVAGEPVPTEKWGGLLARNVLPACGALDADGSSAEEAKLLHETRKILREPELELVATCTRVPVAVGHGIACWALTREPLDVAQASAALAEFPGVRVVGEGAVPTQLDVAGSDEVLVGRLRIPLTGPGLQFWIVSDNLRKGAATNAVQIAQLFGR